MGFLRNLIVLYKYTTLNLNNVASQHFDIKMKANKSTLFMISKQVQPREHSINPIPYETIKK